METTPGGTTEPGDAVPEAFAEIAEDFRAMSVPNRLQLLLEFSQGLPELPARYAEHPELLEKVEECQSPLFVIVEVGDGDPSAGPAAPEDTVRLYFHAPAEAPTTKGFAGILLESLDGEDARTVLAFPPDVLSRLGLAEAVSPLRMRGMASMLARIQRQIRERLTGAPRA